MIKWESSTVDALKVAMEGKVEQFLRAAGEHSRNQMGELAHKISGTLANSCTYKLYDGSGCEFNTIFGPGVPPSYAMVNRPLKQGWVRTGTNLVYAGVRERDSSDAFVSRTYDKLATDGQLMKLAEKVFKLG